MPEQFRYTDRNGIVFWVDDKSKIPPEYRNQEQRTENPALPDQKTPAVSATRKPQRTTAVRIANNQIIVPVRFVNKGRAVTARMILDTGASTTIIYPPLARKLAIGRDKASVGYSTIADGSQVLSYTAAIDYIQVDDSVLKSPEVVVMPQAAAIGADGLLGNSFLKFFNFTIDYGRQMIIWN